MDGPPLDFAFNTIIEKQSSLTITFHVHDERVHIKLIQSICQTLYRYIANTRLQDFPTGMYKHLQPVSLSLLISLLSRVACGE